MNDAGAGHPPLVREPRQSRSQQTLERIVRAAEELLREKEFEHITIGEIVQRAGSSTGSFYARFQAKEALLPYLYERYDRRLRQELPGLLAAEEWARLPLPQLARRVAATLVELFRANRPLLRAVALYARARPADIDDATREARAPLYQAAARLFAAHHHAIPHPQPERAVAFALFAAAAVCREMIVFAEAPHAQAARLPDEVLAAQVGRLLLAYLTCPVDADPLPSPTP